MEKMLALIGFGEAGRTFAAAGDWVGARAYDRLTEHAQSRDSKHLEYSAAGIIGCDSLAQAIAGATCILSLVTADQAPAAAAATARTIGSGALYLDMNSVAPDTKRAAASVIDASGGRYVDVAIMAPVGNAGLSVPLLLSGCHAEAAGAALRALGFVNVTVLSDEVGHASSVKMIRSVMVKGIEALSAECALAAAAAGVSAEVFASLDSDERPKPWVERADYNLDRMMIHGLRRAAEMEEVAKTLNALGTGDAMTRGTIERQRTIGCLGITQPAVGLLAKTRQIHDSRGRAA